MKFLRNVFYFLASGTFLSVILFAYGAFKLHWWLFIFAIVQLLNTYIWLEILHTIVKKRNIPNPQSLVFKKEILDRYRLS